MCSPAVYGHAGVLTPPTVILGCSHRLLTPPACRALTPLPSLVRRWQPCWTAPPRCTAPPFAATPRRSTTCCCAAPTPCSPTPRVSAPCGGQGAGLRAVCTYNCVPMLMHSHPLSLAASLSLPPLSLPSACRRAAAGGGACVWRPLPGQRQALLPLHGGAGPGGMGVSLPPGAHPHPAPLRGAVPEWAGGVAAHGHAVPDVPAGLLGQLHIPAPPRHRPARQQARGAAAQAAAAADPSLPPPDAHQRRQRAAGAGQLSCQLSSRRAARPPRKQRQRQLGRRQRRQTLAGRCDTTVSASSCPCSGR